MQKDIKHLLEQHRELTHSEMKKVVSHVQRADGEWLLNTVMIEDCSIPFRYRRRKRYRDLKGARVDITYYPAVETVAGMEFEVMKVVRIRRS